MNGLQALVESRGGLQAIADDPGGKHVWWFVAWYVISSLRERKNCLPSN